MGLGKGTGLDFGRAGGRMSAAFMAQAGRIHMERASWVTIVLCSLVFFSFKSLCTFLWAGLIEGLRFHFEQMLAVDRVREVSVTTHIDPAVLWSVYNGTARRRPYAVSYYNVIRCFNLLTTPSIPTLMMFISHRTSVSFTCASCADSLSGVETSGTL